MTDLHDKIHAAVFNGLTKNAIEALLGVSFDDEQLAFYRKVKAIYDLKLRQRRKERKYEHLSGAEKKRKHDDQYAAVDQELDAALQNVDHQRREQGTRTFIDFVHTYCIGLMIDDPPSEKFVEALKEMEFALSNSTPYNIELPRGSGKTSAAEMFILYLLATGQKKFAVIVSQNGRSAANILKDIWRPIMEKDTAFAQDFPELCAPFQLTNGSFRRRQLYKGVSTEIEKNASIIHFARLVDNNGVELPTSGSVVTTRGISSGVRGLKVGKLRPDLVLLDDIQTSESASNLEQVQKLKDIINKDIMNLSAKGKLTVIMTSTPIMPDDLCDSIEHDIAWKTTKYKAMIRFPHDYLKDDSLWKRYFQLFDSENVNNDTHQKSLQFYKENRDAMDDGAILFNPNRFKQSDGHISGLQALMEKMHTIGMAAFMSEYQMQPMKMSYTLDITPNQVASRIGQHHKLQVPDGYILTVCGIDINSSYGLTYTITSFKRDMTAAVIYHSIFKSAIDNKLSDAAYSQALYDVLVQVCREIKDLGVKIDGVAIDCGGKQWDAVCQFCKVSMQLVGLPCCGFAGRASNIFNPYVRTRLRNAIGRTVLCGNAEEHVKSGAGYKYVFFDADMYKEAAQRAFLSEVGACGSCSLYIAPKDEHSEFALQMCNEKLLAVQHKQTGQDIYHWKTKEPHDFLDTMAMCYAVAAQQGLTSVTQMVSKSNVVCKKNQQPKAKPRIKVI